TAKRSIALMRPNTFFTPLPARRGKPRLSRLSKDGRYRAVEPRVGLHDATRRRCGPSVHISSVGRRDGAEPPMDDVDYLIVGGGTAGCILANRLTASGRHRALLVEAGGEPRSLFIRIPAGFGNLLRSQRYNWGYESVP